MDYEKAYKERFERAKSIKDSIIASNNKESASYYTGIIDNIFPELKESDDERIRKELLEVIKHCYEDGRYALCTDDYKKYLAYLEKQKEQKPAEWSEEDEEMIARICANLEYLINEAGSDSKLKEKLEERIKWMRRLQSLRPIKQEWSEEDKEKIERLRSIVNEIAFRTDALDVNGDYCEGDYEELDDWLKSLRPQPHWKPSKEQMKQLETAADLPEFGPMVTTRKQFPDLESLYADLQNYFSL